MEDQDEQSLSEIVEAAEPVVEEITPEPEVVQEQPEPGEKTVPLAALHEEREKRRADSERLKVLEQELEALKAPAQRNHEQATPPDMFEDPEGYNNYWETRLAQVQQTNQAQLLDERLNISERYARDKHGEQLVEEAKQWAIERMKARPAYQGEVLSQSDPYAFVVQEYQRDRMVSELDPTEFEQFRAWKASQQAGVPQPPKTTANSRTVARKAPEPFDADESLADILQKS